MRRVKDIWMLILVLFAVSVYCSVHQGYAIRQLDMTIDCLETLTQRQAEDIEFWMEAHREECVKYVALKELIKVQVGRIQKITSGFHICEMELLAEIERLEKQIQDHVCRPKMSPGFPDPPNQEPIEPAPPIPECR